ncbi:MAG TPA: transposase [Patescibacteria group bacterium]|nr:transposase [Patescibacteria group bacterium]
MDRYPTNLPIIEHTTVSAEVLIGPERRRRWTFEEKARIVDESMMPDVVAGDVARRHGVHPNQLYGWRRDVREAAAPTAFVAVAVSADPITKDSSIGRASAVSGIELRIGDAELRIGRDVDAHVIMAVIRALKVSS